MQERTAVPDPRRARPALWEPTPPRCRPPLTRTAFPARLEPTGTRRVEAALTRALFAPRERGPTRLATTTSRTVHGVQQAPIPPLRRPSLLIHARSAGLEPTRTPWVPPLGLRARPATQERTRRPMEPPRPAHAPAAQQGHTLAYLGLAAQLSAPTATRYFYFYFGRHCTLTAAAATKFCSFQGTYSAVEGATSIGQCTPCQAGTWSDVFEGKSSGVCKPCPAGTFSIQTGLKFEWQCQLCPKVRIMQPNKAL